MPGWWFGVLIGCVHGLGVPKVTHGEPRPIPLVRTSIDDRWYVPMEIDGEPWVWFLDTGYSHTACDDGLIEALGLSVRGSTVVRGELGRLRAGVAILPDFEFGGHPVHGLACQVRDLNSTSSIRDPEEVQVAGVLGMDVLRPFRVTLDPQRGQVWLEDPRTVSSLPTTRAVPVRRELWIGTRVKVPARIGTYRLWPIVDTGASSSHLPLHRFGFEPAEIRHGVLVRGSGGSGTDLRTIAYYEIDAIALGRGRSGLPARVVGRRRGPGLLGLDVLQHYRMTFDFRARRAWFESVRPRRLPRWSAWRAARGEPGLRMDQP